MSDNVETVPATTTTKSTRTKKEKAPKVEKPKKVKVDKYNGFKVPAKAGPKSTKCVNHIYDMIKEGAPALLQRDDVRTAFNNFVDCLRKYDDTLESWAPAKYAKYTSGIMINESDKYSYLKGLTCRFKGEYDSWRNADIKKKMVDDANDVLNTYRPLYELIKRDIVPYMEIKQHEIKSKKDIEYYHTQMEKLERDIKVYEQSINHARKTMCEYAEKALKLQQPPTLTKFD
jgi:hypothetical protein